ncbi:membrane-associated protease 1 [Lysinibacillus telephonicus]|uniref:Membrane-associated protease 1 n=1 Tax=Lysinibacillus telephonicus TaxID=1714840 RepID=A0A431USF5_9BACI|nr:membrane-associated protease 1 [Lysinibacillus telephonicus]RTQ92875.1 membrane-associated protease 1 [Lysinibacillus telephonicus]
MGFRLRVEGAGETIELGIRNIEEAVFGTDTPDDTNARSTDVGATLKIKGKILTATTEDGADDTIKLAEWSTVPAEKLEAYREVTLEVEAAGQTVRKITLPHAFVVDYREIFGDSQGIGRFELLIKQKKDKTDEVAIDGNFQ